jgi:hypothetical protein
LVAAWVAVWAAPVPKRAEVPPELPPEVAAEWARAAQATYWLCAGTYGTVRHGEVIEWYFEPVPAGAMPAFYFDDPSRSPVCGNWIYPRTVPVDFSALPKPGRPFGLIFDSTRPRRWRIDCTNSIVFTRFTPVSIKCPDSVGSRHSRSCAA